jgi:hypothetical protein
MAVNLALVPEPAASSWQWPEMSRVPLHARAQIEAAHNAPAVARQDELAILRQANAALVQRVAALERAISRMRLTLYGGTMQEARHAGLRVPDGATGKLQPLHELIGDGMAVALGQSIRKEREAVAKRLEALEQRPQLRWQGVFTEGTEYPAGSLCMRRGSAWLATVTTKAEPGKSEDWAQFARAGRDGRDAPGAIAAKRESAA